MIITLRRGKSGIIKTHDNNFAAHLSIISTRASSVACSTVHTSQQGQVVTVGTCYAVVSWDWVFIEIKAGCKLDICNLQVKQLESMTMTIILRRN